MTRLGFGTFAVLCALVALISLRVLILPVALAMDHTAHFASEAPLRLWGHLLFAPLAMLLAPVQLWAGLRRRRPRLHRWSGRVYGVSVLVAGLAGLTLAPTSEASQFARLGFMVLAL